MSIDEAVKELFVSNVMHTGKSHTSTRSITQWLGDRGAAGGIGPFMCYFVGAYHDRDWGAMASVDVEVEL